MRGPPRKYTQEQERQLIRMILQNPPRSVNAAAVDTVKHARLQFGLEISLSTAQRLLHRYRHLFNDQQQTTNNLVDTVGLVERERLINGISGGNFSEVKRESGGFEAGGPSFLEAGPSNFLENGGADQLTTVGEVDGDEMIGGGSDFGGEDDPLKAAKIAYLEAQTELVIAQANETRVKTELAAAQTETERIRGKLLELEYQEKIRNGSSSNAPNRSAFLTNKK